MTKRILSLVLAAILLAVVPAALAEDPLTVYYTKGGFEAPPENDTIKAEITRATGIDFEYISPANYADQMWLLLTENPSEWPDIVSFVTPTDPFRFWDEGALMDLTPYLELMPAINELIPQRAMDFYKVDGKQIAIPKWTTTKRYNLVMREDWLDRLNLEIPTTLEEFHDVAWAFTYDDPDGNGENDTYGISGLGLDAFDWVFGAFGVIMGETNWNAPDTHCNIYFKDIDGELVPMATLPEMKEALTLLASWFADGIIDPDFAAHTNGVWQDKAEASRFGITTHWWNWEAQREVAIRNTVPEASLIRVAPPIGPTGMSGLRAVPEVVCAIGVMANSKRAEDAAKFMDYLHTEEGMLTSYTGVEGLHWEIVDGKYLTTPQFDEDNKWIQWYFLFENEQPLYKVETYLAPSRRGALEWNVIRDDADGITCQARLDYRGDLTALCAETFTKMIMGTKPLDDFDAFVAEFMAKGGQEWTDQVNEQYKK
ncbi:MAG: extracellular solute-binding protein [Clostridia bacterium]|nr:extracellular solute-binding protein [Clostridia bacterium]